MNKKISLIQLILMIFILALGGFSQAKDNGSADIDPWEGFNRVVYRFNNALDTILKPVARTYKTVTPKPIKSGISNFFANINDVNTAVNQLLQFKFKNSVLSIGRIAVNTSIGLAGLIEILNRPSHKEDFGQTLGFWGVASGPYLMLPFLGPSTVRDGLGQIPISIVGNPAFENLANSDTRIGIYILNGVQIRAALLPITDLLEKSGNPYLSIRNTYLQKRAYDIADGNISFDEEEF